MKTSLEISTRPSEQTHETHVAVGVGERDRRIHVVSVVSLLSRGSSVLVAIISTPFLIRALGTVEYGIYETVLSLVMWVSIVQVGIGPSLVNSLPALIRSGARCRVGSLVTTALWTQVFLAIVLLFVFGVVIQFLSSSTLLNAPPTSASAASAALVTAIVALALGLPGGIARSVLSGFQEGHIAAAIEIVIQLTTAMALMIALVLAPRLLPITVARMVPAVLVASAALLYIRHRFALRLSLKGFDRSRIRQMTVESGHFTSIAIAGLVITGTDNLVIAHVVGPQAVTPYALTWKIGLVAIMVVMAVLDATWPAYRDAVATKDFVWLRARHRQSTRLTLAIMGVTGLTLILAGRPLVSAWAGPAAAPSQGLLLAISCAFVVQGVMLPAGRLLTSIGGVRENARVAALNAAINLPLSILLAYRYGSIGVAAGTLIGYLSVGWLLFVYAQRRMRVLEEELT